MANANILKGLREGVGGRKRSLKNVGKFWGTRGNFGNGTVEKGRIGILRRGVGILVCGVEAIDDEGEA